MSAKQRGMVLVVIVLFAVGSPAWMLFRDRLPFPKASGPSMSFRAEYWYSYLRCHPDLPRHFYRIRPDERGAVVADAEDCAALRAATGGLPKEQIVGYWDGGGTSLSAGRRRIIFRILAVLAGLSEHHQFSFLSCGFWLLSLGWQESDVDNIRVLLAHGSTVNVSR